MPTISDNDARQNARLRIHHLETSLQGFKTLLDKEYEEREKKAGILRRAELATLLGLHESTAKLNHEDLLTVIDHRLRLLMRERVRRVWWRRLLRWLRTERTLIAPDASYHPR